MNDYRWHCLACGAVNERSAASCAVCACPAEPGMRQIADYRARHVQAGGSVLPGAATDSGALSPRQLLLPENRHIVWQIAMALYALGGCAMFWQFPPWLAGLWVAGGFPVAYFSFRASWRVMMADGRNVNRDQ